MSELMKDVLADIRDRQEQIDSLIEQLVEAKKVAVSLKADNDRLKSRNDELEKRQKKHEKTLNKLSHERNVAVALGPGAPKQKGKRKGNAADVWKGEAVRLMLENQQLRCLALDMRRELNYESVRAENGTNGCLDRMAEFDKRMEALGITEAN